MRANDSLRPLRSIKTPDSNWASVVERAEARRGPTTLTEDEGARSVRNKVVTGAVALAISGVATLLLVLTFGGSPGERETEPAEALDPFVLPSHWEVQIPRSWAITRTETDPTLDPTVILSNLQLTPEEVTALLKTDPTQIPQGAAVVLLQPVRQTISSVMDEDTQLPLAVDEPTAGEDFRWTSLVQGNGAPSRMSVLIDSATDGADAEAASLIARSLRFPSIGPLERSGEWDALGRPEDYPAGEITPWGTDRFGVVVAHGDTSGFYALELPEPRCPVGTVEGSGVRIEDGYIVADCADNTVLGRFDRLGNPAPDNQSGYLRRLHAYRIVTAWDGMLLVSFSSEPPRDLTDYWHNE